MAEKVLIYAGTTEGRLLAQELSRAHIACDVHVATEYGQMVMPELAGVKVCVGRLDVEEMRALLAKITPAEHELRYRIEREIFCRYRCDCRSAVGIHARIVNGVPELLVMYEE